MTAADPLLRLADLAGIETTYEDAWGNPQTLPRDSIAGLLAVLGVASGTGADLEAAVAELENRSWRRPLPPVQLVREHEPVALPLVLPAGFAGPLAWRVEPEDGSPPLAGTVQSVGLPFLESRTVDGSRLERRRLTLPLNLPLGYHSVALDGPGPDGDTQTSETTLIIAPPTCYQPSWAAAGRRSWGFAAQLYALRSERNWGIGDFTDLARLAEAARAFGAGVVGVNPLHAGFLDTPQRASPYGPASRLFLNVLYLDIEVVADFAECAVARDRVASPEFQRRLAALRAAPLVDYAGVAGCKLEILDLLYRAFAEKHLRADAGPPSERGAAFRRFQREAGPTLRAHASFEALASRLAGERGEAGRGAEWPAAYRRPDSAAVREFLARAGERVEFHEYLQWLAADQLAALRRRCEALGLDIGLYLDLAVGVAPDGSDAWADRQAYAAEATIGAPADIWNPKGQSWALSPLHPQVMRERAYAPFVAVLRASMRHAGALRIDHVLALMHLWWIPCGRPPAAGGFVRYPLEDLLGIVALESRRNRCLVIGEDLGTVPQPFKERLQRAGILSYKLLFFEQDAAGRFLPPADYPRSALASITTHDLPTLAGYWAAHDLDLRRRFNLFPTPDHQREAYARRAHDRTALIDALRRNGLWPAAGEPAEFTTALSLAAHVYLARSPAMVLMVQFEDVLALIDQVNLPGTTDEHPNWRRKLPADLDALLSDPRLLDLAERIRVARGVAPGPAVRPGH